MSDERLEECLDRWEELRQQGKDLDAAELCSDCPELVEEVQRHLAALRSLAWLEDDTASIVDEPPCCVDAVALQPGSEPIPGYRLVRLLGRGGFGSVWRATGPGGFDVALKFVPLGEGAGNVELRALEAVRSVRHPNLLALFGAWQAGGLLVVAAELAEGTLLDRLRAATATGLEGIPRDELLEHLADAARGLDHLHQAGVQHRDVKPSNLLLVGGRVKVGDFGLAVALAGGGGAGHSGRLTPAYAAPEFFEGATTAHSDQYALAATYCHLRGGRPPFGGSVGEVLAGHLCGRPDLTMLPEAERPVVARALARRPRDRWPTCLDFVTALASTARQDVPAASPPRGKPARGLRLLLTAVVLGCAVTGLLLAARLPHARPGPEGERPPAEQGRSQDQEKQPPGPEERRPAQLLCLEGHLGAVTGVAFAPDGRTAASSGEDGGVLVWDLTTGKVRHRLLKHTARVCSVAFSPDGRRILSGGGFGDNTVQLWDATNGRPLRTLKGHEHGVRGLAFLPDGRRAVSCSYDGTVRLWDLDSGRELRRYEGLDVPVPDDTPPSWGRQVWSLAVSADGRRLLCGLRDGSLRLFDADSGRLLRRLEGHGPIVTAAALSADGRRALSGARDVFLEGGQPPDSSVRLWDAERGCELHSSPDVVGGVWAVALSGDGRRALVGGEDGGVVLLDPATGRILWRFGGHRSPVAAVALSADGAFALSGGADGTVRLWRLPE